MDNFLMFCPLASALKGRLSTRGGVKWVSAQQGEYHDDVPVMRTNIRRPTMRSRQRAVGQGSNA